jgi:hypothetical protein
MKNINIGTAHSLNVSPKDIREFYKDHWVRQICLSDPKFYSWQFIESPVNPGMDECVVALAGEDLCGVIGVNSRQFYLKNKMRVGGELTTWVVSESHRGKGLGPAMLEFLMSRYEVLIGMGITKDALPLYLRSNFKFIKVIPRYLRVFNLDAIAEYASFNALGTKLAVARGKINVDAPYVELPTTDDDVDQVFSIFSSNYQLFSRRRADFRWRYDGHPVYDYKTHLLATPSSKKRAIVVTRHQDLPNGQRMLRVMDVYGDDEALIAASGFIDTYCRANNYALADFFCLSTGVSGRFIANGWFSVNDEDCFQFPHLFEPIELRTPPSTSLIYWASHDLGSMADHGRLYITKQDADLDRPVYLSGK